MHCLTLKYFHWEDGPGVFQIWDVNVASCIAGKTNIQHSRRIKEKGSHNSLHLPFFVCYDTPYCFRNQLHVYRVCLSEAFAQQKIPPLSLHLNTNAPLAHSKHIQRKAKVKTLFKILAEKKIKRVSRDAELLINFGSFKPYSAQNCIPQSISKHIQYPFQTIFFSNHSEIIPF